MTKSIIVKTVFIIVLIISSLNVVSCTVAANYPQPHSTKPGMSYKFGSILYENQDFRLVMKRNAPDNWVNIQRIKEKMKSNISNKGMPESKIQELFDPLFCQKFPMECKMEKEENKFAFFRAGLVFNKHTVLSIKDGAFRIRLKSPAGQVSEVKDNGMLIGYKKGGEKQYHDSRRNFVKVNWYLQKVDYSKGPNIIYFRLPLKFKGWFVESIAVDETRVAVTTK